MAATDPHQQGLDLLSGYTTPSNLLPEFHKESFDKWYRKKLQYREDVKSDFDNHQASVDWASNTSSSRRLADIAHGTPADGTKCGGSLEEIANALVCIGAGVSSQDLAINCFSNDDPGAGSGQMTPALEELDLIIEQDSARTHQQVLDQQTLYQQRRDQYERHQQSVLEEQRRDSEARMPKSAAEERARVAADGIHVKGRRRGLPLLLEAHGGSREVMTCFDTGTHDNHMAFAQAIEMGYTINPSPDNESSFQLPNGKIIKTVGHVVVAVQFARHVGPGAASITCHFNVFEKLALPVLIGMTFLRATETLTKYTSRMVDLPAIWKRSLRLCTIGNATNKVACTIDGRAVYATADTGSELTLVSGTYAAKHRLLYEPGCEELELADGSLEYTSGFADVIIRILATNSWETKVIRLHIWEALQLDVILDEETVEDLRLFQDDFATIISAASYIVPSLSPIIHLGSVEASFMQAGDKLGEKTKLIRTSLKSKICSIFSRPSSSPTAVMSVDSMGSIDTAIQTRAKKIPALISQLDQAENRRLDWIEKGGTSALDDTHKQWYELNRTKLLDELRDLNSTQGP